MTACTGGKTGYTGRMVGIGMADKIGIMTTVTVTGRNIAGAARGGYCIKGTVSNIMTTITGIMNLTITCSKRYRSCGTGCRRMAGITVSGICYMNCMVSVGMADKVNIMTTVTITGRNVT
jgi:hypothetical protein